MIDWREVLRTENDDADAVMTPERAQAVRRRVLAAAAPADATVDWPRKVMTVAIAAGLFVLAGGMPGDAPPVTRLGPPPAAEPAAGERRQLRFATPGGTRIIWELNPAFSLTETLP